MTSTPDSVIERKIDRTRLRVLAENATPGPWETDLDPHGETRGIWPTGPGEEQIIGAYTADDGYDSQAWTGGTDENLSYIAAAHPGMILDLLDALERAEARIKVEQEPTDDFTRAARAEAERRTRLPGAGGQLAPSMDQDAERDGYRSGFMDAAEWARAYLAAQEPTDAEVEAGLTAAEQDMPAEWWGATAWRRYVEEILSAARTTRRDEEK